jgi:hypothetical protein
VNDNEQLILEYLSSYAQISLLFDIESDGNSGFKCVLVEVTLDHDVGYGNSSIKEEYATMTLTPTSSKVVK